MKFILNPSQLMLIVLASWINREQQQKIECLETQLAVLKEQFGSKRILLTDDQRRRIAVKGKVLGRKQLSQMVSCLPATRGREASTIATAKPELERTSGTLLWIFEIRVPLQTDSLWREGNAKSCLVFPCS